MRDYEILRKALMDAWRGQYCSDCELNSLCNDEDSNCYFKQAADAIEELLDELTTIRKQLPHWISVEELLAERTAFWVDTQPHLDDSSYKKDGMSYYCSNCRHRAGKYKHRSYKFCPWCGAKIVPKETAIADMLPPLQIGEDADDLIEQVERFQEYVKGGAE